MDEKQALVPRLRFPEFRDAGEWDIASLKELANRRTERNRDGKLTRVLTNSAEHGVVDQRDYFDKDIATQGNLENYFVVKKNDFVYNPRISSFAPVGPISRNGVETGVMSPLYTVFQFKGDNTEFYAHYFKSSTWHMYMRQVGSTGARHDRMAISNEDFMAMPLPVPSADEQQKIADCLSSLDALITAQADKIDALKTHKKGLMQQLFPREGETVPRLRFPEFRDAGEWSEATLGEIVDIRSGYSPSRYNLSGKAQYAFLKVEDLNNCEKYQTSSREFSDDILGLVPAESIIFPKRGAAILNNKVRLNTVEVLMDTNLMAITPKRGVLAEFLYCIVVTEGLSKIADTSTIPQINNKHITPHVVRIPGKAEQQKIAECLSYLDMLVTANTEKLDVLKTHKRGLMQQLFPSPEAVS